jgi:thiol-disulfide isomerase/thioredoxin
VIAKKILLASAVLMVLGLLFSSCKRPWRSTETLEIGSPAPAFMLPDVNGKIVSLDQFRGKIVMLDFWATWCGPCRMTMPLLENLQKEYSNNMVLLAINLRDPADVVKDYMRQEGLHSQVLLDEQGTVGEVYGAGQIPMQVLIDKAGIVRNIKIGFNPSMASPLRAEIEALR